MLAAIITTGAFLPQVYKTWKTKNTKGLSLTMYVSFFYWSFIMVRIWFLLK